MIFHEKLEFRFLKGLSIFKKLGLKYLCRSTNIYAPGGISALIAKVNNKYNLQVTLHFHNDTIRFSFENLVKKVET